MDLVYDIMTSSASSASSASILPGWWFGCHFWHFPIHIGFLSSSQLTDHIFQRGGEKPPTSFESSPTNVSRCGRSGGLALLLGPGLGLCGDQTVGEQWLPGATFSAPCWKTYMMYDSMKALEEYIGKEVSYRNIIRKRKHIANLQQNEAAFW